MAWQQSINGSEQYNACGMGAPTSTSTSTSIILPPPPPPPRRRRIRWRTKHYLSVAMVGALVAIALVAAISISLAPARLTFSVVKADVINYFHINSNSNNTHLNFTLHVENGSPLTAVWYGGPISGEVSYGPSGTAWVRFSNESGIWQAARSPVDIFFSADYGYRESTQTLGTVESCQILMVLSKVRFHWLGLSTLPYTVRLTCEAVNFVDRTKFPVSCA